MRVLPADADAVFTADAVSLRAFPEEHNVLYWRNRVTLPIQPRRLL